jgi:hypothetical protein
VVARRLRPAGRHDHRLRGPQNHHAAHTARGEKGSLTGSAAAAVHIDRKPGTLAGQACLARPMRFSRRPKPPETEAKPAIPEEANPEQELVVFLAEGHRASRLPMAPR